MFTAPRPDAPARSTSRTASRSLRRPLTLLVAGALLVGSCTLAASGTSTSVASAQASAPRRTTDMPPLHEPEKDAKPDRRPNVLMVMTDDMRVDELAYLPSVRRYLADRGLTFHNSFSPYPLCCPARASFMSGRYAHNHGVFSHKTPYGFGAFDDSRTLATVLYDAGYNTGFVGKYLNGYGAMLSRVTGKPSLHYVPAGWTDWHGGSDGGKRLPAHSRLRGNTYNYFDTTFNVNGRLEPHEGEYQTTVLGQKVRDLITRYHRAGAPFFIYLSTVAPHGGGPREKGDPVQVARPDGGWRKFDQPARPRRVKGMFDAQITASPGLPADGSSPEADITDKPSYLHDFPELSDEEREALVNVARQRAESLWLVDQQFAKIVAKLKATGEYDDTILMFTSDNGYFLGEHRIRQGKVRPYEPALRVPFLVAGPKIRHGNRYDPIKTMDVTATIADLANARFPYDIDGRSLLPTMRYGDRGWRVPVLTEALMKEVGAGYRLPRAEGFNDARDEIGVRTAEYKYIRYATDEVELYDLTKDPNELRNVAGEHGYAAVERRMHRAWIRFKDCNGVECRGRLPKALQVGPTELKRVTRRQARHVF